MDLFFTLALPIIIIIGLLRVFKVKWPIALLIVFGLAAFSTFIVNFTFCEILKTKCEPHGLNVIGYFFHWLLVSSIASALDFMFYKMFNKQLKPVA
ncbi:hypothetical protein NI389_19860 (plasmid) [Pseudoalteromonas xiamenensis]|uniref:hypothetical protein n=1 Tax=Pseudoalteromonas xiamenensis TaxID=882626 RepID=UPI0027E43E92|nr:hypothetical protein [Pseudoalteromonas xiamenensis]WMN62056.1 hypothetical protein NI389_19860 [Pseudoalteromonas xiamenensis]